MSKTLSTADEILARIVSQESITEGGYAEYTLNDEDLKYGNPLHNKSELKAQLRTLVEKFAEELIGEDEIYLGRTSPRRYQLDRIYNINDLRSEQRENVPKLLEQMFGGGDE